MRTRIKGKISSIVLMMIFGAAVHAGQVGHGQTGSFCHGKPPVTTDYYQASLPRASGKPTNIIDFSRISAESLRKRIEERIRLFNQFNEDYERTKKLLKSSDDWGMTPLNATRDTGSKFTIPCEKQIALQEDDQVFADPVYFILLDPQQKVLTEVHEYLFNIAIAHGFDESDKVRRVMNSLLKNTWDSNEDLVEVLAAINDLYKSKNTITFNLAAFPQVSLWGDTDRYFIESFFWANNTGIIDIFLVSGQTLIGSSTFYSSYSTRMVEIGLNTLPPGHYEIYSIIRETFGGGGNGQVMTRKFSGHDMTYSYHTHPNNGHPFEVPAGFDLISKKTDEAVKLWNLDAENVRFCKDDFELQQPAPPAPVAPPPPPPDTVSTPSGIKYIIDRAGRAVIVGHR